MTPAPTTETKPEDTRFFGTDATKQLMPTVRKAFEQAAFVQAEEFIGAGQSAREATSLMANILIQTAWILAATGALTEEIDPDKDKFRGCVESALEVIQFKERQS